MGYVQNRRGTLCLSLITWTATCAAITSGAVLAQTEQAQTLDANGTTLEYVQEGTGEPVVFVHGSISDHRVWSAQRGAVAAEFEFIAYTRRYFGEQPWADKGENFGDTTQSADLIGFVEALGRGPVHLVAHSGGGGVADFAAVQRPDLFQSLVLFEPGGSTGQLLTTEEGAAANAARQEAQAPGMAAVEAGNLEEAAELFLDATFNRPGAFDAFPEETRAAFLASARTLTLRGGTGRHSTARCCRGLKSPPRLSSAIRRWPIFSSSPIPWSSAYRTRRRWSCQASRTTLSLPHRTSLTKSSWRRSAASKVVAVRFSASLRPPLQRSVSA